MLFQYVNHNDDTVVEIEASDILEADKLYFEKTKIQVAKAGWIGCQIIKTPEKEKQ